MLFRSTLTALLSLSIPPPASATDVPRVVTDLQTKKAWFEANQSRVTTENIAKAEAEIQRLVKSAVKDVSSLSSADTASPSNGGTEHPPEPVPTPSVDGTLSVAVSGEEVDEKLEPVAESAVVA